MEYYQIYLIIIEEGSLSKSLSVDVDQWEDWFGEEDQWEDRHRILDEVDEQTEHEAQ